MTRDGRAHVHGQTVRWSALYDVLLTVITLGGERRYREVMLDRAGVDAGERVLDVGCGTGTLAIAAKRRVGATGTVNGVDAATEMVTRAQHKARRAALDVTFDVAPAQVLPFPDATFDVALCTLMMHHLPAEGRRRAVAEIHRVLRPGGRLLVVDLATPDGLLAALNPISILHGHNQTLFANEAAAQMRSGGFNNVVTGKLNSRVIGYALGTAMARSGA